MSILGPAHVTLSDDTGLPQYAIDINGQNISASDSRILLAFVINPYDGPTVPNVGNLFPITLTIPVPPVV